jgi:ABC-type dipeptide/oligopeptide/nickel transport system permease subunit
VTPTQKSIQKFRHHRPGLFGLGLVLLFVLIALLAGLISPFDPLEQDRTLKLVPPFWIEGGQWPYVLGTDVLGRDVLSRILYGSRVSLSIGLISVVLGALIGVPVGLISGYAGGRIDTLIMRVIDIILAFPSVLLAICIVAILGPSLENAMIAIGLVSVPQYARVVRASVLSERERDYVHASLALGQKPRIVLFRGILPNVLGPVIVIASLNFASAVLEAAALSFIGLGAQPPTPEWGALLYEGKKYYSQGWWLVIFPGFTILLTVMGFNLVGDGLRDALDPRT